MGSNEQVEVLVLIGHQRFWAAADGSVGKPFDEL
jgi:hypothetical protein